MTNDNIQKHFGFLETNFGFKKIPEYAYSREVHNDFIKDNLIVKIIYDGAYWVSILKSKNIEVDIFENIRKTVDYDYGFFRYYDVMNLDFNKELYNFFSLDKHPEKDILYFSELLKSNSEILNGNLTKFGWKYKILRKIGLIK